MLSYYRYVFGVFIVMLSTMLSMSAQTPVEKVMIKYEDVQGAKNFVAQGIKMTLARNLLKSTQVAPIASDVDELYIFLKSALKQYDYYGTQPSKNGEVEVYVHHTGPQTVDELVIYNPEIYSLNSLYGHFTVSELLTLAITK